MTPLAIEAHRRVVMLRRHEQAKAIVAQHALDRVLPRFVGNLQDGAEEGNLLRAQTQLGAQEPAQARSFGRFGLVTGVVIAGAELADLAFELLGFFLQLARLLTHQCVLLGERMPQCFQIGLQTNDTLALDLVAGSNKIIQCRRDGQPILFQEFAQLVGVLHFAGERLGHSRLALCQCVNVIFQCGNFLAQFFFPRGGRVSLPSHLRVELGLPGALEVFTQHIAPERRAVDLDARLVQFQSQMLELRQLDIGLGAALNVTVRQAAAAMGNPLLIEFLDAIQRINPLFDVDGQRFKMAQCLQLILKRFHIHQVLVEQIVVDKLADVGQRTERQALDDLGGKSVFELTEPVEQMKTVIFDSAE